MSIFGKWGKQEAHDSDQNETKQESENASEKYETKRQEFLDSLRVEPGELNTAEKRDLSRKETSDSSDDTDDEAQDNVKEREVGRSKDDDDGIR